MAEKDSTLLNKLSNTEATEVSVKDLVNSFSNCSHDKKESWEPHKKEPDNKGFVL